MMPIPDSPLFFGPFVCYVCGVKVSRDYRCDKLDFKKPKREQWENIKRISGGFNGNAGNIRKQELIFIPSLKHRDTKAQRHRKKQ
jgi:hypothetical protein